MQIKTALFTLQLNRNGFEYGALSARYAEPVFFAWGRSIQTLLISRIGLAHFYCQRLPKVKAIGPSSSISKKFEKIKTPPK
jgi:hypothetical protein